MYFLGFVKSNRPSDSPTKETDSKGDAKDVDLSQRSNSNEEDKENINLRESENKTPGTFNRLSKIYSVTLKRIPT